MTTRDPDGIRDQNWAIVDPGSTVVTADGEEFGSVRERMPHYLELRVRKNLLSDVELYVPRELIDRVDGDRVVLNRTATELNDMDLSKPPALREGS